MAVHRPLDAAWRPTEAEVQRTRPSAPIDDPFEAPLFSADGSGSAWAAGGLDLAEFLRRLRRRKWLILSVAVILTTLVAIAVSLVTPRYTASVKILLEASGPRIADLESVLPALVADKETVDSEIQVITSRRLAMKVIDRLNLHLVEEFNPDLREWDSGGTGLQLPSMVRDLALADFLPESWLRALGMVPDDAAPAAPDPVRARTRLVDTFLSKVDASKEGQSRVVSVTVESEDPEGAATIANTLAELYLLEQLERKFEATERATHWLNERLAELRVAVETSERAAEQYRSEAGLIEADHSTVTLQQLSQLNSQLIAVRGERAQAEATLSQVEPLVGSPTQIEAVPNVLFNPVIQGLRGQEAELRRRAAELSSEYGPQHPRMTGIRAEIADLRANIAAEIGKIVAALRNEVEGARARERALEANLRALEAEAAELGSREVQLRALEREAEANRTLLETFLRRFKETSAQENLQEPDARIISNADPPLRPSFPKKTLMVGLGLIASLGLGVVLALLVEHLDPGLRSTEQVERRLGVGTLALVPLVRGWAGRPVAPEKYLLKRPASAFAESLRTLQTGLMLSNGEAPPKVVLLTSALPGEGKSTLAVSLGHIVALNGRRVIVVDADLRHPRLAGLLGLDAGPGLVDVLTTMSSLEAAIQVDSNSELHALTAGHRAMNPNEMFSWSDMHALIRQLASMYELVIIDSPPVLAVSDARLLSRMADRTVFVVRWATTRREVAAMGLKLIREAGANVAGVVLSVVNVRKHAQYGFGDSGAYYGPSRRYYAD